MAVGSDALELRLIQRADGVDLSLRPLQGTWTEEQYLTLTKQTNHLIELTDGVIDVLPMPTSSHQAILLLLYDLFRAIVQRTGGIVLVAPMRLRVRPGKHREPDILLLRDATDPRNQDAFWLGADLVVEVVSPDRPERDTQEKPRDYAEAGIPEYWIVDPLNATVTVLVLEDGAYGTHGVFHLGERATSRLFEGFSVPVEQVFQAT
jgi:Uma2 family endonuclease